jgi:hypothetical protein
MSILLTLLFSFYPAIFIYSSIPAAWMKKVDAFAPTGNMPFIVHAAVFAIVFFFAYNVLKKYVSLGYRNAGRGGMLGITLLAVFNAALALITFYNILPGETLYASPALLDTYLLKNPYTFIAFAAPWLYLFFD